LKGVVKRPTPINRIRAHDADAFENSKGIAVDREDFATKAVEQHTP
jgi:hypothetical protein